MGSSVSDLWFVCRNSAGSHIQVRDAATSNSIESGGENLGVELFGSEVLSKDGHGVGELYSGTISVMCCRRSRSGQEGLLVIPEFC